MAELAQPVVCVAIPVYNGARYVGDAVRSVLSQTYPRVRVLVADNASSDATGDIVSGIGDERVDYRWFAEHVPVAHSFARALEHARGDCVLLLAADNQLEPQAIATLVAALRAHPDCDLAYGRVAIMREGGEQRWAGQPLLTPRPGVVDDLERRILDDGFNLSLDGVLFRYGLPELRFDPAARGACDLDLLLRVGRAGVRAVGVPIRVAQIREHRAALSERREAAWNDALEVLERHLPNSRHPDRVCRRIFRNLVWLTIYLLQRGEREAARAYLSRFAPVIGRSRAAVVGALIALPALRLAPLAVRGVLRWSSERTSSGARARG